jgi:hypothetical protein
MFSSPPTMTATLHDDGVDAAGGGANAKLHRTGFANRHYCRNPHCRLKLPEPVSNDREAFCSRGCHARFFRTRCRVCEGPIEQPVRGTRRICDKAKYKNAWRAGLGFGQYHDSNRAKPPSEVPVNAESGGLDDLGLYPSPTFAEPPSEVPANKGPKVAVNDYRARPWWVVAAGKPLSANQYHCAIVGTADAVAAADRANAVHWRGLSSAPTITISATIVATWTPATASVSNPEDLSIPAFLRRASAASGAP